MRAKPQERASIKIWSHFIINPKTQPINKYTLDPFRISVIPYQPQLICHFIGRVPFPGTIVSLAHTRFKGDSTSNHLENTGRNWYLPVYTGIIWRAWTLIKGDSINILLRGRFFYRLFRILVYEFWWQIEKRIWINCPILDEVVLVRTKKNICIQFPAKKGKNCEA